MNPVERVEKMLSIAMLIVLVSTVLALLTGIILLSRGEIVRGLVNLAASLANMKVYTMFEQAKDYLE